MPIKKKKFKAGNYMNSGLSKGAYAKKVSSTRAKAFPTYKSGFSGGKPINFSSPKTKRGVISSID